VTTSLLERHRTSGRVFTTGGIRSFALDDGPWWVPVGLVLRRLPLHLIAEPVAG
jgi:hypothetical protein